MYNFVILDHIFISTIATSLMLSWNLTIRDTCKCGQSENKPKYKMRRNREKNRERESKQDWPVHQFANFPWNVTRFFFFFLFRLCLASHLLLAVRIALLLFVVCTNSMYKNAIQKTTSFRSVWCEVCFVDFIVCYLMVINIVLNTLEPNDQFHGAHQPWYVTLCHVIKNTSERNKCPACIAIGKDQLIHTHTVRWGKREGGREKSPAPPQKKTHEE